MSSRQHRQVKVKVDGATASALNPDGERIANLVKLPTTLSIDSDNGRLICRRIPDSLSASSELFTVFPSIQIPRIQQRRSRSLSHLRAEVEYITQSPRLPQLDETIEGADWLNYVLGRGKPTGLIKQSDGIRGLARQFMGLRILYPEIRILITAVKNERLDEFNKCLVAMSEGLIPTTSLAESHPQGVRILGMNAQAYFSRNRYVPGPDEPSISGLEPYHIVLFIDPHEALGPRHLTKMRLALMAGGCHVLIGVITRERKTLKNELRALKHYLGDDVFTAHTQPRRKVRVWSLLNDVSATDDSNDSVKLVRAVIIQNEKRNNLICRIAVELLEGRWPFNKPNNGFFAIANTVCLVVFNPMHKENVRQILHSHNFETSEMGWLRRAGKYIKIFSLAEFDRLEKLPSNCIVNADGRGHSLQLRSHQLRRTADDPIPNEITVIEIADRSANLSHTWRKKYPQADCVEEVTLRPGGIRRRGRR